MYDIIKATRRYAFTGLASRGVSRALGAEPSFWRSSWTALTRWKLANLRPLYAMRAEAARGVAVRDFCTISCEFASSSSRALADPRSRSAPTVCVLSTTRRAPIWRAGPRSARSTRWCLRYSPWPRRQCILYSTEESLCKRKSPWRSIHAAPRLCAPLPAALPEPQSSQILRAAWYVAPSQLPSRRVMAEHV